MRKKKIPSKDKEVLQKTYTLENWNRLNDEEKRLNTLNECRPCKHVLQCESPAPKPPKNPKNPSTPVTPMQALSLNIQIPITSGIPASLRIQKAAAGSVLNKLMTNGLKFTKSHFQKLWHNCLNQTYKRNCHLRNGKES